MVPGRHQQATLTAHVEVMGAQVLGQNSAAKRTRAMLVQVMPHALVRSPATGALGVAKQAPRHGAEAADRLESLCNPLPTPRSPIPISSRWRTGSGRRPGRIAGRRPRMSGFPDSHACIATSAPKSTRDRHQWRCRRRRATGLVQRPGRRSQLSKAAFPQTWFMRAVRSRRLRRPSLGKHARPAASLPDGSGGLPPVCTCAAAALAAAEMRNGSTDAASKRQTMGISAEAGHGDGGSCNCPRRRQNKSSVSSCHGA